MEKGSDQFRRSGGRRLPAWSLRMRRISRFGDRHSYKPSEVVGLFVISLFGGMVVFGICMLVSNLVERIFG